MDNSKEIDVLFLVGKVLKEKILLMKFVAVFAVIGVIYAINKPKEWTSIVVLAPEASSMGMTQGLGDIANMIGLGSSGSGSVDAIYPDIYPEIFASPDFVLKMFDLPVRTKESKQVKTYYEHLDKDIPKPFWTMPRIWIKEALKSKDAETAGKLFKGELSEKDAEMCDLIRDNISCQLNKGNNLITISVTDFDPYVSTIVVDTLQSRLQEYITVYRTKKAMVDLEYSMKINAKAKAEYQAMRKKYLDMADSNTDIILHSVSARIEDLENEMQQKYNVYAQTTAQVEKAKMKVQESTPAFTIIQSPIVPTKSSSTPRSIMVIVFMILGVLADSAWVLYLRKNWKQLILTHK